MDISVVIISWNRKDLLTDCIRSIMNSPVKYDREIIVVDNASADGAPEMVEKEFPDVRLIRNPENYGFARANNIGIQASKGRYLCLGNSDTLIREDALDKMCEYMDANSKIAVLGPKLLWKDFSLQWSCRKFPDLWNTFCPAMGLTRLFPKTPFFSGEHMGYFEHDRVVEVDALVGAFLMVRQKAAESVGLMDEHYFFYCEEIDWCKRFKKAGWKNVFFPKAEVVHIGQGSASQEPARFKREFVQSNYRYWKKHHNKVERFFYFLIILCRHGIRLVANSVLYIAVPSLRKKAEMSLRGSLEAAKALLAAALNSSTI